MRRLVGYVKFAGYALALGLMAFIVVMPIPFGNVLPALALMLIGLGLVFRDGVAVVLEVAGAEGGDRLGRGLHVLALVDLVLELDLQALGLVFGRDGAADAPAHAELIDP